MQKQFTINHHTSDELPKFINQLNLCFKGKHKAIEKLQGYKNNEKKKAYTLENNKTKNVSIIKIYDKKYIPWIGTFLSARKDFY